MLSIIAHNIRSLHNVGAIFRSADAFGVEKIYLTGYTGTPPRKEIAKVALGSEHHIDWEQHDDPLPLIAWLKSNDITVAALDNRKGAEPIIAWRKANANTDIALLLGNEVDGVDEALLEHVDATIEIPLIGRKQSLNVSVATGVALFALTCPELVS